MNNNNLFISKTLRTFLTSLIVSVFIFGSLYFFLSDNSTPEVKSKDTKLSTTPQEKSKKLVVDEESDNTPANNAVAMNSAQDTTKNKVDAAVAKQNEPERQVLGAKTDNMIAQIPGASDYTSPFQQQAVTQPSATPTVAITGTLPANLVKTNGNGVYATGVPKTGNESLYIVLALFSAIAGFLIVNGKSFAYRSFERF